MEKVKTPRSAITSSADGGGLRHRTQGFTLVELLVVFAIGALFTVLVPIAFGTLRESSQYRQTLRTVITDMRTARSRALAEGSEIRFTVNLATGSYGIAGRDPHALPEPLQIRATVADIEMGPGDLASIRFLPTGGATGGSIDIVRSSGAGVRLSVDWLSGRVAQSPLVQ